MTNLSQDQSKLPECIEKALSSSSIVDQSKFREKYNQARKVAQTKTDDLLAMVEEPYKQDVADYMAMTIEVKQEFWDYLEEQDKLPEEERSGAYNAINEFHSRSVRDLQAAGDVFKS